MKDSRPYAIDDPDGLYFVTFATVYWIDVFTRKRYKDMIVDSLKFCQEKKGLELFAWCLMRSAAQSNHLHLIIRAKEGFNLSDILRDFKKFTASQIIRSMQEDPESRKEWMLWLFEQAAKKNTRNTLHQFWQQGNHAEQIFTEKFGAQKLDYLHNNPVEEGWVENAWDYLYSSARNYAGEKGLLEVLFL
ncbi:MAG: transposase [Thermoflexibacter sp.]|nr:transposase [Thermoflexibacter sp.]